MTTFEHAVVVIPAHNESAHLPDSLKAVVTAAACSSMTVLTVVVLDACDDASAELAGRFGSDVHFIEVDVRNVGASRAAAASETLLVTACVAAAGAAVLVVSTTLVSGTSPFSLATG